MGLSPSCGAAIRLDWAKNRYRHVRHPIPMVSGFIPRRYAVHGPSRTVPLTIPTVLSPSPGSRPLTGVHSTSAGPRQIQKPGKPNRWQRCPPATPVGPPRSPPSGAMNQRTPPVGASPGSEFGQLCGAGVPHAASARPAEVSLRQSEGRPGIGQKRVLLPDRFRRPDMQLSCAARPPRHR